MVFYYKYFIIFCQGVSPINVRKKSWLVLGLIIVGLLPTQTLAKKPVYIPEIKTVTAQLIYFRPALKQTFFEDYVGDHKVTSNETVVLTVGIPRKQYRAMPIFRTSPSLFLGRFSYDSQGGASGGPIKELYFHVTNWQEIPDGEPIIVTVIPGGQAFPLKHLPSSNTPNSIVT